MAVDPLELWKAEKRKEIEAQNAQDSWKDPLSAGLSSLAAAFQGKDSIGAAMGAMERGQKVAQSKLDAFDKGKANAIQDYQVGRQLKTDQEADSIDSPEASTYRGLAKKFAPTLDTSKMSVAQIQKLLPSVQALADMQMKQRELAAKTGRGAGKLSEGQKKFDQEFAKDANEWTSGGSQMAESEIKNLESVASMLDPKLGGKLTTGGLTGMLPDRITSDDVLKARAAVQSSIMNSLRPILGAQFTEKEGERVIKNTWNEADSTENNLARINRLIKDLKAQSTEKNAKTRFFEDNAGSLYGYKANPPTEEKTRDTANAKPKKIVQKGKTFILNDQTGEYEYSSI